jgi:hypothetical protein
MKLEFSGQVSEKYPHTKFNENPFSGSRVFPRRQEDRYDETNIIMKVTNKMQLYRLIYYSYSALHVSGDVFAHHQEHLTVFTVSGSIHPSSCRLVSWMG